MSVARSGYALSNEYDISVYTPSTRGLSSTVVTDVSGSPSMAVAFGGILVSTTTTYKAWKSTNGIDWTEITSAPNTAIFAVAYGNDTFVAVGAAGLIYTSAGTDGLTWTSRTKAGSSAADFNHVQFLNGYFWAKQYQANMMRSTDGITWELLTSSTFTDPDTRHAFNNHTRTITYMGNQYIWWTGNTVATTAVRAYISTESNVTSGWANNSFSDSIVVSYVQQDPGDGLGPVATIGTSAGASNFARLGREFIHDSYSTSGFSNQWSTGGRTFVIPQNATGSTFGPTIYISTDGQAFYTKFTDGMYFHLRLGSANYGNSSAVYGLIAANVSQDGVDPISYSNFPTERKPKFVPLYRDTTWATNQYYCRSIKPFSIGEKHFVWWGFNEGFNSSANNPFTNNIVVMKRAIRPLKTTIDVR
jgi:hypothetical protein